MIRFLYNFFSWVPVLGGAIKAAYIASLIAEIKVLASKWSPKNERIRNASGSELDSALSEEANALMDEFLAPLDLGMVASAVKSAAVEAVVSALRSKLVG